MPVTTVTPTTMACFHNINMQDVTPVWLDGIVQKSFFNKFFSDFTIFPLTPLCVTPLWITAAKNAMTQQGQRHNCMRTAPPLTKCFQQLLNKNNSLSVLVKQSYIWPIFAPEAAQQTTCLQQQPRSFESAGCRLSKAWAIVLTPSLKIGFTSVATWQPGMQPVAGGAEWLTVWDWRRGSLSSFFMLISQTWRESGEGKKSCGRENKRKGE